MSARLGHSNLATTQRIYVHQFDAARRSDDRHNRLAALYGATDTGRADPSSISLAPISAAVTRR